MPYDMYVDCSLFSLSDRPFPGYLVLLFHNLIQDLSYKDEFDLHDREPLGGGTYLHMNGFGQKLVLK